MADQPGPEGTPRWVKVFGLFGLALVVVLVLHLTGRSPGGHMPTSNSESRS